MPINYVYLHLTPKQKKMLDPLFEMVKEAEKKQSKGAIFCQVYENHISVRFIPNEKAAKISLILSSTEDETK